jgi:hypothetical protein
MRRYIRSSTYDSYISIKNNYPLVATLDDDLYGRCLSVYDQSEDMDDGKYRYALLDDQNKDVVEIREHSYDSKWIYRYIKDLRDHRWDGRLLTINYSPNYRPF